MDHNLSQLISYLREKVSGSGVINDTQFDFSSMKQVLDVFSAHVGLYQKTGKYISIERERASRLVILLDINHNLKQHYLRTRASGLGITQMIVTIQDVFADDVLLEIRNPALKEIGTVRQEEIVSYDVTHYESSLPELINVAGSLVQEGASVLIVSDLLGANDNLIRDTQLCYVKIPLPYWGMNYMSWYVDEPSLPENCPLFFL